MDLKIVFTGLVLLCFNQTKDGETGSCTIDQALLVNARHDAMVCGRKMEGGHYPKLSFNAKHLLPGSIRRYTRQPTPDGYWTVVAPLDGIELCIGREDPRSGEILGLTGAGSIKRDWQSRDVGQTHPAWYKKDASSFGWVPHLQYFDDRATRLRKEVDEVLSGNEYVVARVPLSMGTLKVPECSKSGGKYVLWDLHEPAESDDFPKALPDKVLWTIPGIHENDVIVLHTCKTDAYPPQILFRLQAGSEDLKLHISNDPEHEVHSMAGPALEHFRWFYHLVDWPTPGGECPKGLPVPAPPHTMVQGHEVEEAVSQTIKCSPAGSG